MDELITKKVQSYYAKGNLIDNQNFTELINIQKVLRLAPEKRKAEDVDWIYHLMKKNS